VKDSPATSRVLFVTASPREGSQSTYFEWWLRYCGIEDVHELRLQPTFPGEKFTAERERVMAQAHALARTLASQEVAR
jgi:hypothetical protein